ncbi:MAG: hypothetical protein R3B48_18470 [Kofleriaceae bacterium]
MERAALYLAVAEMIDPHPVRQLATLDTPIGLHTFPLENGAPVILDPQVPRNCLDCGLALLTDGPVQVSPRDAVEWTAYLGEVGAASVRNGPSRVRHGRNAIQRLVDQGVAPTSNKDVESIAWLLSLAEQVARRFGPRALAIVRSTSQAIADLADEALALRKRNVSIAIGEGRYLKPAPWASTWAKIAGRVGMDVGMVALRAKLASMGVPPQLVTMVEEELKDEGISFGRLASSPELTTYASALMS